MHSTARRCVYPSDSTVLMLARGTTAAGRARAIRPDLSESRGGSGANGRPLPHCWAGHRVGRAPPFLILGVSWAASWCGGSPERTATVEPVASRPGSCSRSELPGHRYRAWTASGTDSDEVVSLRLASESPGPVLR